MLNERGLNGAAEACFRQAADASPASQASRLLGRALVLQGRYKEALPVLERAVAAQPANAECWNLLGIARREESDMPGARQAFDRAIALQPDFEHAWINLGNWLLANKEPEQALQWFDKVLIKLPDSHEALNNRIVALLELGRVVDAETEAEAALARFPDSAPLLLNLGNSYLDQGKTRDAVRTYRKALELEPDFEEAHYNLSLFGSSLHLSQATQYLEREIKTRGRLPGLLNRLAIAHMENRALAKAEQVAHEILDEHPGYFPALVTLGNLRGKAGDIRGALNYFMEAIEAGAGYNVHSNVLFQLNYFDTYRPDEVFEKHLEWASRHEAPLLATARTHVPCGDRDRRLKIGYVSPDFLSHPVGYLSSEVLTAHDRQSFEVHCYSHAMTSDGLTEKIRKGVEHWHDTTTLNDAELAELIVEHGIDILVDLSGHTAQHRLPAFARKPAPIQVSWIGYFHSTGMRSIDYFITDPYSSPKGYGQHFSEIPVWLPHTRFCYTAPDYAPPVAQDTPCVEKGYVTLGCFNKIEKITDSVAYAWAKILLRLPDAKLRLKAAGFAEQGVRDEIHRRFAALGIAPERIELSRASPHDDMLREYDEMDIALDPFPFTGGITTFEALWMGVPVVTLAGAAVVGRQSASALHNLGLSDLVNETIDDYIDCAVRLASDRQRLSALRCGIRPAMAQSPLCDSHRFVRDLENLYRRMWHAWCDGGRLPSDIA